MLTKNMSGLFAGMKPNLTTYDKGNAVSNPAPVKDFNAALEKYMRLIKDRSLNGAKPVSAKQTSKYVKIETGTGVGTSIHSFIDSTTGDVYMPAGIHRPAKGVRGNIFTNFGADALDSHGLVRYLR